MSTTEAPSAPSNKLYVGNIEYRTTKADIKDLFKDYNVTDIEIPQTRVKNRGAKAGFSYKTKGYVFVTFGDDVKDLDSIIEKFTDSEFKGRQIYLRYPKVKSEEAEESTETGKPVKKTSKTPGSKKEKPAPKEKIPFDQGERSTDTLYLKNLDFTLKSKDIKEFFEQEGEKPEWVSVPFLNLPSYILTKLKAQGKSLERRNKGYAFVKLNLGEGETIDDKVSKFNGKTLNERELLVSVAVDVRNVKGEEEAAKKTEDEAKGETEAEAEKTEVTEN